MATYNSDQITQKVPQPGPSGDGGSSKRLYYTATITAALTTADTINLGYAPKGFRVHGAVLKASDMDTNGSPTLALNVGDAADPDRIFAASNIAQTGTYSNVPAATIIGYQYTDDTTMITVTPSTNAATGVAGTLSLVLLGTFDPTSNT